MEGVADLGLGIGWRPELAHLIDRHPGLGFVELTAENHDHSRPLPEPIRRLGERGVKLVVHGLSLSLGGAEPPDPSRLSALASLVQAVSAPLVSEHLAFVRGGGREAGHLLSVARTRDSLELLVENVSAARAALPVPLALENIAALVEWPDGELSEAELLAELLERCDCGLLLDVSNLHANAHNHGLDPLAYLDRLPLQRLAYVHVGGGVEQDGIYHDTHAHAIAPASLELLEELAARAAVPGVMLERDDAFPPASEVEAELEAIREAVARGTARRARQTLSREVGGVRGEAGGGGPQAGGSSGPL